MDRKAVETKLLAIFDNPEDSIEDAKEFLSEELKEVLDHFEDRVEVAINYLDNVSGIDSMDNINEAYKVLKDLADDLY